MKHLVLGLTLLAVSCGVSPAVWAACGTTVVDVGVVTTVTVSAGPNESCDWLDENANNASLLSVAGVVVPAPLRPVNATIQAHSVSTIDNGNVVASASCQVTGLVCAQESHGIPAGQNDTKLRYCSVDNESAALSATATCVYQALTP